MKSITFSASVLFILFIVAFQAQGDVFVRKIENGGYFRLGIQTVERSYVTASHNEGNNIYLRKTNATIEQLWLKRLSVEFPSVTYLNINGIIETSDQGFVLIGEAECGECSERLSFIFKLDEEGRLKWKKGFANPFTDQFHFNSVHSTPDGGFIIPAETNQNKLLIRFTSKGDVLWKKSFSFDSRRFLESISTSDNGLVLFYGIDGGVQILKFDELGNSAWARTVEIPLFAGYYATAGSTHNGFVIAGIMDSELFLVGLKEDGQFAWKKAYFIGRPDSYITSVRQSSDNALLLTATVGDSSLFLKVDSSRNIVFQKLFPLMFEDFFIARSSLETPDGGFLVLGNSAFDDGVNGLIPVKDQFLLKLDSKARSASCVSQVNGNLTTIPFPSVKVISGPKLDSTNSIALHEKPFKLTLIDAAIRTLQICSSGNK